MLGFAYLTGRGVRTDPKKALIHLQLAAEGHDTAGSVLLAEGLSDGSVFAKDCEKAGKVLIPVVRSSIMLSYLR